MYGHHVHQVHGILPHPGLHPLQPDRGHVMGQLLPGQGLSSRQDRPRGHHGPHNGHPHGVCQQVGGIWDTHVLENFIILF